MSMQNLMMAGNTLMQIQTMQSVSTRLQGRANVLRAEMKQDGEDEKKMAQVEELEGRAQHVMEGMMETALEVNKGLQQEQPKQEGTNKTDGEEEKAAVQEPAADRTEISEIGREMEGASAGLFDAWNSLGYTNTGMQKAVSPVPMKVDVTV